MRALASVLFILLGPASLLAEARPELEILRARCLEQERQIRALETEIESLHSQVALERRRARGLEGTTPAALVSTNPAPAKTETTETYLVKTGDTLSSIARRYHTSADVLMKQNGIEDATKLRVGQKLVLSVKPEAPKAAPVPKETEIVKSEPAKPATAPASTSGDSYKVVRGDTLYGIARKHKMSLASLQALNPTIDSGKIIVGQKLAVSGKAEAPAVARTGFGSSSTQTISTRSTPPAVSKPAAAPAPKSTPASAPVVKKEEPAPAPAPKSLSTIILMEELTFGEFAKKHGTTTDQLNALNNLNLKSDVTLAKGSELYVPGR